MFLLWKFGNLSMLKILCHLFVCFLLVWGCFFFFFLCFCVSICGQFLLLLWFVVFFWFFFLSILTYFAEILSKCLIVHFGNKVLLMLSIHACPTERCKIKWKQETEKTQLKTGFSFWYGAIIASEKQNRWEWTRWCCHCSDFTLEDHLTRSHLACVSGPIRGPHTWRNDASIFPLHTQI